MLGLQAVQKVTAFVFTRSRQALRFHLALKRHLHMSKHMHVQAHACPSTCMHTSVLISDWLTANCEIVIQLNWIFHRYINGKILQEYQEIV